MGWKRMRKQEGGEVRYSAEHGKKSWAVLGGQPGHLHITVKQAYDVGKPKITVADVIGNKLSYAKFINTVKRRF